MIFRNLLHACGLSFAFIFAVGASAQEITLRCVIDQSKTSTGNSELDRRLNADQNKDITIRYYVVDDAAKSAWRLIDGKRESACGNEAEHYCSVIINKLEVIMRNKTNSSNSLTRIDRYSGSFHEEIYYPEVRFIFGGGCDTVKSEDRKF